MDKLTIGIPKALLYYKYKDLWISFFENLDLNVIISPNTNKEILDNGKKYVIDEACLSMKIFMGHVSYLVDKCDYILVPRIACLKRNEKVCTNFMAIYDLVRNQFNKKIITYNIDVNKKEDEEYAFITMGLSLGFTYKKVKNAYLNAKRYQMLLEDRRISKQKVKLATSNKIKILLAGHAYNLYDNAYYLGNSDNPYIILVKGTESTITSCDIHENTIIIYQSAFYNYSELKEIDIPNKVLTIHKYAFYGCQLAEHLVLGENIKEIGYGAFSDCTSLRTIQMNCSLHEHNYIVPNSSSYYEAFANAGHNSSELTLIIGAKVTSIPRYLFYTGSSPDAPYITCIMFEEGSVCENIDYNAFGYCRKIKKVVLPNSINVIYERSFESYASFDVFYLGTATEWGEIDINQDVANKCFNNIYFYSEVKPTTSGKYWHYVDGVPTVWN